MVYTNLESDASQEEASSPGLVVDSFPLPLARTLRIFEPLQANVLQVHNYIKNFIYDLRYNSNSDAGSASNHKKPISIVHE